MNIKIYRFTISGYLYIVKDGDLQPFFSCAFNLFDILEKFCGRIFLEEAQKRCGQRRF